MLEFLFATPLFYPTRMQMICKWPSFKYRDGDSTSSTDRRLCDLRFDEDFNESHLKLFLGGRGGIYLIVIDFNMIIRWLFVLLLSLGIWSV